MPKELKRWTTLSMESTNIFTLLLHDPLLTSSFRIPGVSVKIGSLDTRIPTEQLRKSRDKGKQELKVEEGKCIYGEECVLYLLSHL